MRRGILTVDVNTDVYDFQFSCCLKHRAPTEAAIFCGLKSQIRFYIKLTQVLPYNAGNLRQPAQKKYSWPRKREAPTSWTTPFRMKDSYPSFLQIDLPFTHRASHVSSCQSLFLVFFSVKPLKKISLATNILGKFAEIYFCCCLFVVVFVVLLYCLFLYHFASGSCSLTLASLQAHMPFGPSVLIQVYSSAGSWETPRHYLTVCSYGLALGMRDGELEKLWGGGK